MGWKILKKNCQFFCFKEFAIGRQKSGRSDSDPIGTAASGNSDETWWDKSDDWGGGQTKDTLDKMTKKDWASQKANNNPKRQKRYKM